MKYLQMPVGELETRILLAVALKRLAGSLEVTEEEFEETLRSTKAVIYKEAEAVGDECYEPRMGADSRIVVRLRAVQEPLPWFEGEMAVQ